MPIPILGQLAIGLLGLLIAYAIMPKPKQPKPPSVDDLKEPTASVNRARPVVFGSMQVRSPNVLQTADKNLKTRTVSVGK